MSAVFEGDEWRYAPEPGCVRVRPATRAEQQSSIDEAYANGRISLAEWRKQTEFISTLSADGLHGRPFKR